MSSPTTTEPMSPARSKKPHGIPLHTAHTTGTRSAISCLLVVLILVIMGGATRGLRHWEFPPLAIGLTVSAFLVWTLGGRLRYSPFVYGSPSGLDLQWINGTERHIDWSEILEVRVNPISGLHSKRFRLYLVDEALELEARADFAEIIAEFQKPGRAEETEGIY